MPTLLIETPPVLNHLIYQKLKQLRSRFPYESFTDIPVPEYIKFTDEDDSLNKDSLDNKDLYSSINLPACLVFKQGSICLYASGRELLPHDDRAGVVIKINKPGTVFKKQFEDRSNIDIEEVYSYLNDPSSSRLKFGEISRVPLWLGALRLQTGSSRSNILYPFSEDENFKLSFVRREFITENLKERNHPAAMENIDEYEFVEENEAPPYHRLQPPPHMGSRGRNTELPSAPQSSPAQGASPSAPEQSYRAPEQSYPLLQWPTPGPTLAPLATSNPNPGSSNSQLNIGFNFPPPPVRPASESQADQRVGPSTPPYHPHAPPLQQFTNFHSFTQVSPLQRSVESRESEAGVSTSAPYSSPITGAASTASSEAVQPPLSFRFEDSFEDRTDRTDRTLPRSGHLSITPNPAVVN